MSQINDNKLVSICIPVYNNVTYLKETLISILNQTYKNLEIIIGDNASTDNIEDVLNTLGREKFIYYKNEINLGYAGNCNKMINMAKGEYIAIYHSDDLYLPTIVEEEVRILDQNPEIVATFTLGKTINEKSIEVSNMLVASLLNIESNLVLDLNRYFNYICRTGNILPCPTSMVRKNVYLDLGGYNTEIKYYEDQEMWTRILEKYKMMLINKELFKYRVHGNQGSSYYKSINRKEILGHLKYVKNYIDEKKIILDETTKTEFYKRYSEDYNKLIQNTILRNDNVSRNKFICESKNIYKYRFPSVGWFFQHSNNYLIKILLKSAIWYKTRKKF